MLKVLSLFSGIGAFEKALENLGIKYELVGFSEIDKYASASYYAIHGVDASKNLGDITKIDESKLPKDIDLITYGFPCQDISLAGRQKGLFNEDGTQTRSGLFFDALRIIETTKPKFAIAENVKNLTGKKFKEQFQIVLQSLENAGYVNYWKVLNAKDFGIPQNRERVFIISIRSDVDQGYEFPIGQELTLRLKDMLEEKVDEKYYLKETGNFFIKNSFDMEAKGNGFRFEPHVRKNASVAKTITTRAGARMDDNFVIDADLDTSTLKFDSKNPQLIQIGQIYPNSGNPQAGRVYNADGISPTMDSCSGGNRQPKIAELLGSKHPYELSDAMKRYIVSYDSKYKVSDSNLKVNRDIACAKTTREGNTRADASDYISPDFGTNASIAGLDLIKYRIRKLTPKECWRLMGFDDADIEKAQSVGISNSQLYKQAGNSIVVPVLEEILRNLLCKR